LAVQFLSRLMRPAAQGDAAAAALPDFAREQGAGTRLPYAAHLDGRTLMLRDGTVMQMLRLDGLMFETAETQELNHRKTLRDAMLRAIGSSRFALYTHVVRRRVAAGGAGAFPDAFSARLDAAWQGRLAARELFTNDLYWTLIRRPAPGRGGMLEGVGQWLAGGRGGAAQLAGDMRALDAAVDQVLAALASYGARRLEVYEAGQGQASELLEVLGLLYNGVLAPVRLPPGDAGDHLPRRRVSFGADTLELGPMGGEGPALASLVSIKDYPGETMPGMLDDLLRIPCEMVVSQSFAFVDRGACLSRMNLALRRMRAGDDEAVSLRAELAHAKDDVAAGRASFGEHHLTVMLRGGDQAALDANTAEVQAVLSDLGMVAVREDVGLELAFWAQFPGNFAFVARRALIGSANFAGLSSGHNFPQGAAQGGPWGPPVSLFETTAAGPYHFNFHHGDLGNFSVIGPSGSGKTVIVNFLLAQARRLGPRIVFFDKDRGGELFIRAIAGTYRVLRPGVPSGINPLAMADTPANRRFLADFLMLLACPGGAGADPAMAQVIGEAVAATLRAPLGLRHLGAFVDLLRGTDRPRADDLYARLRPWWGDGAHGWLFDNPGGEEGLCLASGALGFDMTALLDDPLLRTPAMMLLFHRIEQQLDGSRTIIVVDEGWKALDDPLFVARIRDWEKTLRKRGAILGFVTQNAQDALESRIAGAIVEQTATQIFTPNPRARAQDYVEGFGLTTHELALIRALPEASRCFLVKQGQESAVLRLNLAGEEELLTILSGRERTVRLLDAIRDRMGDDPAAWMPELLRVA
jgi:type IV secretion system protein VirB4